jgi:hypothetical protein
MIRSQQSLPVPAIASFALVLLAIADTLRSAEIPGQAVVASTPAPVVLVTNVHAFSVTKHPTLPLLYLTCSGAPESRNLVTLRLNADGSLMEGSQRTWPNYLSTNSTNITFRHSIPRPVVFAERKVLYLAAYPSDAPRYCAETNNNEVAIVGLDEQGQPAKLLQAFRTTNPGHGIKTLGWDPVARRLFFSYDGNGWFGWCQMDRDGLLVSSQTHFLAFPNGFWSYVYLPEWQRFYGSRANTALGIMRLAGDGLSEAFIQYAESGTGGFDNIELSRKCLKLYALDGTHNKQVRVYRLTHDGRLTGVPRFFPLAGEPKLIRFDFKAGFLYALSGNGALKIYPLDSDGYPTGVSQMFQLSCDEVRDAVVDEATGKVYVACRAS